MLDALWGLRSNDFETEVLFKQEGMSGWVRVMPSLPTRTLRMANAFAVSRNQT